MDSLIAIVACALAAGTWWILIPARAVWHDRKLGVLADMPCDEAVDWPSVSVLVPARNEADTLEEAVRSLLAVDYPELEIILVNDRSTDRTGEIVEHLAQRDERIRTLHIETLPEGWLGKVHALHRGIEISRGEWLLFTDADIHFSRRVLKRAIARCLRRQRGFLALLPSFRKTGLVVSAAQTTFGMMLLSMLDFSRISDPESSMAMGVGAFNLARRSYIDSGEGLTWLRMEVADDAGLALMMKRRGAGIDVLSGQGLIEVDWYPTLAAMLDGVMQRFIMGAHYRPGLYLVQCALVCFCLVAPAGLGLALASYTPLAWFCLGAYAMPSLILAAGIRNFAIPGRALWGLPIGFVVVAYGMLRTLVTCIRRGGVYWRGTVYPLRELRASQRVKMGIFI